MIEAGPVSPSSSWKLPFFTIWTGQAFSLLGSSLVQFALIWWLTVQTGSATVLATITLVGMLPQILLGPLAGTLVDRWNRRIVMMVADSLVAAATLGLIVLFATGAIQVWHIYVAMLLRSAGGTFHWPAMQSSTSLMVPSQQLARVSGMNQTLNGAMNIVAPALGALLISVVKMHYVLMIDVGTAALAVIPLFFIAIPQPHRAGARVDGKAASPQTSVWQEFKGGLRYVGAWPGLLILLSMATLINFLLNPAISLLPLLVTKHFHGQALQLGAINSTWGIGVLVGGVILSAWGGFKRRIVTSFAGLLGLGIGVSLVGFAPAGAFTLAVGAMGLAGLMIPLVNGPLMAVVQSSVAPEVQGRVLTLINSASAFMSPLSLAVAGPLSDTFGIRFWFVLAGAATLFIGSAGFFIPALMNIERDRPTTLTPAENLPPQIAPGMGPD